MLPEKALDYDRRSSDDELNKELGDEPITGKYFVGIAPRDSGHPSRDLCLPEFDVRLL